MEGAGTEASALSRARVALGEATVFPGLPGRVWRWLRGQQRGYRSGPSAGRMEARAQRGRGGITIQRGCPEGSRHATQMTSGPHQHSTSPGGRRKRGETPEPVGWVSIQQSGNPKSWGLLSVPVIYKSAPWPIARCLDFCHSRVNLNIRQMMPPTSFFFVKIVYSRVSLSI